MALSTLDRLAKQNETKRFWTRISLVCVVLLLVVFVGDRVVNGKRGELYHERLVQEFRAIRPLPDASVVSASDNYSPWNSHKALVGASYTTRLPYSEIRQYYDRELPQLGWRAVRDHAVTDWGRDLGGREVKYCKGELGASLQYAGTNAHYGWTFALDLTWGLDGCT